MAAISTPRAVAAATGWLLLVLAVCSCSRSSPTPPEDTDARPAHETGAPVADATGPRTFEEAAAALQPGPNAIRATVLDASTLTPAEQMYGLAPQPHPSISYQKDVVLVAGGANAIRGMSGDGLLWILDASAKGTEALAVGRVAFVTGRCVGRVLHLERQGDSVRLLLGPVELTDIYRRLELTFSHSIDLQKTLPLPAPQSDLVRFPLEGDDVSLPPTGVDMSRLMGSTMPPSFWRDGGQFRHAQVSPGIPQRLNVELQTSRPLINGAGFGAEMRHEGAGTRIVAQAQLQFATPRLEGYIHVRDGSLYAKLMVKNAAALLLAFDAVAGDDFSRNVNWQLPLGGVSFPLAPPVPLSVDFRHTLSVRTVFSGKNAHFGARGKYELKGDIGIVIYHMNPYPVGPTIKSTIDSLFDNMSGASIGPNGIVLNHEVHIVAGVGAAGFTAGPSAQILTSLGTARGSDIGIVRCAGATLAMHIRGGVGWTVPAGLVKATNWVLGLFRVKPIPDHGGFYSSWMRLLKPITAGAQAGICGGGGGT